jgi:hypothetical protein
MQTVERFAPVHRDVRYLRCEQKQQGINRHATHCTEIGRAHV